MLLQSKKSSPRVQVSVASAGLYLHLLGEPHQLEQVMIQENEHWSLICLA